ncbi:SPOR domain-containing protein [Neptunomonas marina]|uniref:SPOR domain-containing protein n=2 Tax=Neptunomonas marina TaxID=1815562 RepID=A0A437QCW4_9GAMM|nr:SPOR domain-containing protein [Neptunomonas marina]
MDSTMKKRLLGFALIAITLAVLLPLFLQGDGYRERQLESRIPATPAMPQVAILEPQSEELPDTSDYPPPQEEVVVSVVDPAPAVPAKPVAEADKRPVKKPTVDEPAPALDEQGVPVAWTLQLASFKDEGNAKALRKQLVGNGHKVYTRQGADLYKVYVGPDFNKERLTQLQARLQSDFGLEGIIIRFTTQ